MKIDPELVENLASIQCSYEEMAAVCKCSPDTLERRFAAVIKEGRALGRKSLKRKQYERAMAGSDTMLIWLGKQYLEQTDKRDIVAQTNSAVELDPESKMLLDQFIAISRPAGVKA